MVASGGEVADVVTVGVSVDVDVVAPGVPGTTCDIVAFFMFFAFFAFFAPLAFFTCELFCMTYLESNV